MIPLIARNSSFPSSITHTLRIIGDQIPAAAAVVKSKPTLPFSKTKSRFPTGKLLATVSGNGSSFVRYAHSDVSVPDFSVYRKKMASQTVQEFREEEENRKLKSKTFNYAISAGIWMGGVYTAKSIVTMFIKTMSASADVLALASIEIPLTDVPEGKSVTFKWRGKPLFIRHRTPQEIETEASVNVSELRDPQTDAERTQRPDFLIVIGVCTHLGCVPIANAGR